MHHAMIFHVKPPDINKPIHATPASCFAVLPFVQRRGFVMAYCRDYLPERDLYNPLAGKARSIRRDDWMMQLPAAIAQCLPPFSNPNRLFRRRDYAMRPTRFMLHSPSPWQSFGPGSDIERFSAAALPKDAPW
jgi:hypothetical protein